MCEDQRVQSAHRAQEGSARAYAKQYNNEWPHHLLDYETPLKLVSLRADGGLRPPGSKEAGTLSGLISVLNQLGHFKQVFALDTAQISSTLVLYGIFYFFSNFWVTSSTNTLALREPRSTTS